MHTRPVHTAYLCAAVLALPAFTAAAQEQPTHAAIQHISAEHHVYTADTSVDHAAAAKRFQQEADRYEKQAAGHEREASEFLRLAPRAPKGTNYPLMAKHCARLARQLRAAAAEAREIANMESGAAAATGK